MQNANYNDSNLYCVGNACYTVRRDNTSIQQNLSFTMTSPTLQPGLYQISFQQMFPFGKVRVDVESENNETYDQESFWKYMERDTKWLNETVNLIEDKVFRVCKHTYLDS